MHTDRTEKWNLFEEKEINPKRQKIEEKQLIETLEEIEKKKEELRNAGMFSFKRKHKLWEELKELERTVE